MSTTQVTDYVNILMSEGLGEELFCGVCVCVFVTVCVACNYYVRVLLASPFRLDL